MIFSTAAIDWFAAEKRCPRCESSTKRTSGRSTSGKGGRPLTGVPGGAMISANRRGKLPCEERFLDYSKQGKT